MTIGARSHGEGALERIRRDCRRAGCVLLAGLAFHASRCVDLKKVDDKRCPFDCVVDAEVWMLPIEDGAVGTEAAEESRGIASLISMEEAADRRRKAHSST